MVQAHRDIAEHLCTYIDPAGLEIYKRVPPEIIVMMMPVDYPTLKVLRGICRIVNETETQTSVFEDCHR